MNNPWKDINLSDYESHMALDSVQQLQAMNQMMKGQLNKYDVQSVMILGIAGGNGLEHVDTEKITKVYGVDINAEYLETTKERYKNLSDILECLLSLPMLHQYRNLRNHRDDKLRHDLICPGKVNLLRKLP